MRIALKRNWLFEIINWDKERMLTRDEMKKIARGSGYYLIENYLENLKSRHPKALFKVDGDYRIVGIIGSWDNNKGE